MKDFQAKIKALKKELNVYSELSQLDSKSEALKTLNEKLTELEKLESKNKQQYQPNWIACHIALEALIAEEAEKQTSDKKALQRMRKLGDDLLDEFYFDTFPKENVSPPSRWNKARVYLSLIFIIPAAIAEVSDGVTVVLNLFHLSSPVFLTCLIALNLVAFLAFVSFELREYLAAYNMRISNPSSDLPSTENLKKQNDRLIKMLALSKADSLSTDAPICELATKQLSAIQLKIAELKQNTNQVSPNVFKRLLDRMMTPKNLAVLFSSILMFIVASNGYFVGVSCAALFISNPPLSLIIGSGVFAALGLVMLYQRINYNTILNLLKRLHRGPEQEISALEKQKAEIAEFIQQPKDNIEPQLAAARVECGRLGVEHQIIAEECKEVTSLAKADQTKVAQEIKALEACIQDKKDNIASPTPAADAARLDIEHEIIAKECEEVKLEKLSAELQEKQASFSEKIAQYDKAKNNFMSFFAAHQQKEKGGNTKQVSVHSSTI